MNIELLQYLRRCRMETESELTRVESHLRKIELEEHLAYLNREISKIISK